MIQCGLTVQNASSCIESLGQLYYNSEGVDEQRKKQAMLATVKIFLTKAYLISQQEHVDTLNSLPSRPNKK